MTIEFRLAPHAAERLAFSYSPAMEAVLSLHVLIEPKHHPVQYEWVRAMRRLSPALKREIDLFGFAYRTYFPEFFFPPRPEGCQTSRTNCSGCAAWMSSWCGLSSRRR